MIVALKKTLRGQPQMIVALKKTLRGQPQMLATFCQASGLIAHD